MAVEIKKVWTVTVLDKQSYEFRNKPLLIDTNDKSTYNSDY